MVELGSEAKREVVEFMLTRYACYLIAQNGDPKKEENVRNSRHKTGRVTCSEDIKKLERRVASDEKKIEKSTPKLPKTKN